MLALRFLNTDSCLGNLIIFAIINWTKQAKTESVATADHIASKIKLEQLIPNYTTKISWPDNKN